MLCRYRSPDCLRDTGVLVLPSTLRDTPNRIPICTSSDNLAFLHQCHRSVQYRTLESVCLQGALSLLHVQILEEDTTRWLDVVGRDSAMHNRYESLPSAPWLLSYAVRPYLVTKNRCMHSGSEAMFADLGHFSQLSIKVNRISYLKSNHRLFSVYIHIQLI